MKWTRGTKNDDVIDARGAKAPNDRFQKKAGVDDINPETFTHGTSAQRMKWFRVGFDRGALAACDTFSANPQSS